MSIKRQATTELNHDNWDQEDPAEEEEMGTFKTASKDILEKRVIRTAKRRSQTSGDEPKKGVFSGFGGFSKAPPSSFDFLANLTNGSKPTNGSSTEKNDEPATNIFGSKSVSNSGGVFNMPTSSPPSKPMFGVQSPQTSSVFGGAKTSTTSTPTLFTSSKTDSAAALNNQNQNDTSNSEKADAEEASTIFSGNNGNSKPLFPTTNFNSSPFKTQSFPTQMGFGTTTKPASNPNDSKNTQEKKDESKLTYYSKLKGLNLSVLDWIKKHVEETPLCILSPIFKDYERHLSEIQSEYHRSKEDSKAKESSNKPIESPAEETKLKSSTDAAPSQVPANSANKSPFGGQSNINQAQNNPTGFTFGIKTSTPTTSSSTSSTSSASPTVGFSFGITTQASTTSTSSSLFSMNPSTTTNNSSTPFSFGIGKPFSFSTNIQSNAEQKPATTEEDDEPPKVEFTPIVEENSVYDKRCKVFVKKDGNFMDRGVGTLYIKRVEETGKYQLLVRANTNLGNVLVNLILSSSIPTQRLGKNNVMLVCIPTPDAKPPPTPILIRVKASEEADELLETLNKYKE